MIENKEITVTSPQKKYLGVGFIKSRKMESKISDLREEMIANAASKSLHLIEVIIDNSNGTVLEKHNIDSMIAWMEKDDIDAIVVRTLSDITTDADELLSFMRKAEKLNVSVYSMKAGMNLVYSPVDGGCGC